MLIPARREATLTEAQTRLGLREHLRQRVDDHRVAGGDPLVHQGGEAAHEIDAAVGRRGVERAASCTAAAWPCPASSVAAGEIAIRLLITGMPYFAPTRSQTSTSRLARETIFCRSLRQRCSMLGSGAVVQVQTQRDAPHVEVLGVQHLDGREDLVGAKHFLKGVGS